MSQITENTIVIASADAEVFKKIASNDFYVRNLVKSYDCNGIMIYCFDYNGQPLCFEESDEFTPLMIETCYGVVNRHLDIYTQVKKDNYLIDSHRHLFYLLKKYITDEKEYKNIVDYVLTYSHEVKDC